MISTLVTITSKNAKLGPMAATSRTQNTCPTSCPLLNNGCYARGRIFGHAVRFGREDLSGVLELIDAKLPNGIRFNVSGDFLNEHGNPDRAYIGACNKVARAHPDVPKIAYTHAWRILDPRMFAFPVNASCETEDEVREAVAAGWQAVMVNGDNGSVIGDKRVVTCLAETKGLTCADCKLCASDVRTRPIVSFTAHGVGKAKATAAVQAKRVLQA